MRTIHEIKRKIGFATMILFISIINVSAQVPAYLCELRNDTQVDAKTFEFDVYLLQTESTPFQYTSMQMGININPDAANSGIITPTFVTGSDLNPAQVFTASRLTFNAIQNCIIVTGVPGPGSGSGTMISNAGFGTKVCRIRLTNSVDFGNVRPDFTWSFSLANGYQTKVNAYIPLATDITVQASHTTSHLANLIMNQLIAPQTVTGGGSYCQGSTGVVVGLANSEVGVTYTLYKNGAATSMSIAGTGSPISFPAQTAGTYTVKGSFVNGGNVWGVTNMIGNAIVTEYPIINAGVSINASANPVTAGASATFTATPVGGGTAPTYQWYKNSAPIGNGTSTFTYVPADLDQVYVVMTSNAAPCLVGSPATSNIIVMSVSIGTSTDEVKEIQPVYVYSHNRNVYVNSPDKINQVYIYSAMGQALMFESNVGGVRKFSLTGYPIAYYFVKIVTDKAVYCQKVLLNK